MTYGCDARATGDLLTTNAIIQGCALVRGIEALETIDPSASFERAIADVLLKAYRRRLRAIIGAAPTWVGNRIFQVGENILDPRAALFSEN